MQDDNSRSVDRKDRTSFGKIIVRLATGLLALAALESIPSKTGAQEHSERAWTFLAADLTQLEVKLVRGNVIVRRGSDSYVRVDVTEKGESTVTVVPTVQLRQGRNVLRIVASYAKTSPRSISECLPIEEEHGDFWATRDLVDVELQIPMHMSVALRSMQGNFELFELEGILDVSTNDGELALKNSAGEPIVTATGSVAFIQHAQGKLNTVPSKLVVYDGDIQLWVKRGEAVSIDGRSFIAPLENVEIARSNDAKSLFVTVGGEHAAVPIIIELSRGRLSVFAFGAP